MTSCTLCNKCVRNCPIGAVHNFENIIHVCDLCGGAVKCVEACTEKAIEYEPDETEQIFLAEIKTQTKGLNESERMALYAKNLGSELRQNWRTRNA